MVFSRVSVSAAKLLLTVLLVTATPSIAAGDRTIMAWANSKPAAAAQLRNKTWNGVFDGVMAYCGIRFNDAGDGLSLNQTQFDGCAALHSACKAVGAKFNVVLGTVPPQAIANPIPVIASAVALAKKLDLDGFSLDDEYDCAPRSTFVRFKAWMSFVDAFSSGLRSEGLDMSAAVQAMMGIQDVVYKPTCEPPQNAACSQACNKAPWSYPAEPRVTSLMSNSSIGRFLEMDTYYFGTGRFLGALDWYASNVNRDKLGVSLMNRNDISADGLLARFHAIERSGVDWLNVFLLPANDEFLPLLRRWKTSCKGCNELSCFDLSVPCRNNDESS